MTPINPDHVTRSLKESWNAWDDLKCCLADLQSLTEQADLRSLCERFERAAQHLNTGMDLVELLYAQLLRAARSGGEER